MSAARARRPIAPAPAARTEAHRLAVDARESLALVTYALRYTPPTTPAEWHRFAELAASANRVAADLARLCLITEQTLTTEGTNAA